MVWPWYFQGFWNMLGGLDLKRFHHILIRVRGGPEKKQKKSTPSPVLWKTIFIFNFYVKILENGKFMNMAIFKWVFGHQNRFFFPEHGVSEFAIWCVLSQHHIQNTQKNRNREINRDFLKYMKNRIFPFFQNIFLKKSRFISRFSHFHDDISKLHKNVYIPTCEVRD